jgi:histidine triad (HIT) family protein
MASIFTKIVKGEIPCYKIAETDDYLAFLDIRPRTRGHALVITKEEIDYLFDLRDELYMGLHLFAKEIARAIEKTVECKRIATAVVGLEVPHCHLHLIPINEIADFSFERPHLEMSSQELSALAESIAKNL